MMKKHVLLSDCLVATLVLLCSLLSLVGHGADNGRTLFSVWCMAAGYYACRLSFLFAGKYMQYILPVTIAAACLFESVLGVLQLIGLSNSNNCFFGCTGSFKNPGPYGGFLAVCVSILGACALNSPNRILRYMTGVAAIAGIVVLPSTMSRAAMLALLCCTLVMAMTGRNGRKFLKKHKYWLVPILVVTCAGAYLVKRQSADGRMFINRMSVRIICRNAWTGVGQGCYAGAYGTEQYEFFNTQIKKKGADRTDWTVLDNKQRMVADSPEYAFNEFLQFGAENGVPAMLLFIALLLTGMVNSYRQKTAWCYGLMSFAVFAMFSYPLHVVAFQILLAVMLAASVSTVHGKMESGFISEFSAMVALTVLAALIICRIPAVCNQEDAYRTWKKTECWYNSGYYDYVIADAESLYGYLKHDSRFLFEYGQALSKTGQYEKSDSILRQGLQISCDPMFWNVLGNNELQRSNYERAVECYTHAFCMIPNRLYPLCRIAQVYFVQQKDADFDFMLQRINSFPAKVESATTEKLRKETNNLPLTGITEQSIYKTKTFR